MSGDTFGSQRAFLKHRIYGTLYAVEIAPEGDVIAAAVITDVTACIHRLSTYTLDLDEAATIMRHRMDFDQFEPVCLDAKHLLADITDRLAEADAAEHAWTQSALTTKARKEIYEKAREALLQKTREATAARAPLPLFDEATPTS